MSQNNNNNNNKYLNKYLINNNKKLEKNKTFTNVVNAETYYKLKEILLRERKGIGGWLQESMEEFIIKHGDGNLVYTLDHFNKDNFLATPAFYRPLSVWETYLTKCSGKDYKKYYTRLEELLNLEKRVTSKR